MNPGLRTIDVESWIDVKRYIIVSYITTLGGSKEKEEKGTESGAPESAREDPREEQKVIHGGGKTVPHTASFLGSHISYGDNLYPIERWRVRDLPPKAQESRDCEVSPTSTYSCWWEGTSESQEGHSSFYEATDPQNSMAGKAPCQLSQPSAVPLCGVFSLLPFRFAIEL